MDKKILQKAGDVLKAIEGKINFDGVEGTVEDGMKEYADKYLTKHIPCDFCEGRYVPDYISKHKAFEWKLDNNDGKEPTLLCQKCLIKAFDDDMPLMIKTIKKILKVEKKSKKFKKENKNDKIK